MIENKAEQTMLLDNGANSIRACGACGQKVGTGGIGRCPKCGGPIITLGPIEWTEEDETQAMEDLGEVEKDGDNFQDVVCALWDKIDAGNDLIDEKDDDIKELDNKIKALAGVVDEKNDEITELKAKLADESLKGKAKKALGVGMDTSK